MKIIYVGGKSMSTGDNKYQNVCKQIWFIIYL